METTLQQVNDYLKSYHQDLTYQLDSGGTDKINFCSEFTPFFDEESEARQYLVDLAIIICKIEGLK